MRIAIISIRITITFSLGVLFMYRLFNAFYIILKTIVFCCSIFAKIHNRVGGFGGWVAPLANLI